MSRYSGDNGLGSMILQGLALGEATRRNREQEELERRAMAERELYNQRAFQFDYDQLGQRQAEFGLDRERFEYGQAQDAMTEEARAAEAQQRREALRESFTPYATVPGPMGAPRVDVNQLDRLVNAPEWFQKQFIEQADAQRAQQQAQLQEKRARDRVRSMFAAKGMLGEWEKIEAEHELTGTWPKGLGLQDDKPPMTADSVTGLQRRDPAAIAAYLNSGGNPNDIGDFGTAPSAPLDASVYARARAGDPGAIMALRNAGAISSDQAGRVLMAPNQQAQAARQQVVAEEYADLNLELDRIERYIKGLGKDVSPSDPELQRLAGAADVIRQQMSIIKSGGMTPNLRARMQGGQPPAAARGGMDEESALRTAAAELGSGADDEAIIRRAEELMGGSN